MPEIFPIPADAGDLEPESLAASLRKETGPFGSSACRGLNRPGFASESSPGDGSHGEWVRSEVQGLGPLGV